MDRNNDTRLGYKLSTADEIYVEMGRWKCIKSPTGAHHWYGNNLGLFVCGYCGLVRKYPNNINDALKLNQPARLVNFMMSEDSYSIKGKGNNGKKNTQYGRKFLPKDGRI